jgi:hypothetical protein
MERTKHGAAQMRGGMFVTLTHRAARCSSPFDFPIRMQVKQKSEESRLNVERSEMSFPVPETSQGAKRVAP